MLTQILLALFFVVVGFPTIQGKYENISSSCKSQLEHFSSGLQNQREWALKC